MYAGARPGVKTRNRDILYELSSTLEGLQSKKRKRGAESVPEIATSDDADSTIEAALCNPPEIDAGAKAEPSSKKAKKKARKLQQEPPAGHNQKPGHMEVQSFFCKVQADIKRSLS